jgi:hypothetical protein
MGLRMRKSIKIAKGVRLNLGKTGASLSFGTRGLRHTIHSSGRRTSSIGIPGTGLSYVTTTSGKRKYNSQAYSKRQQIQQQKQQKNMNEIDQNKLAVEEYNNLIEIIKGIHRECDEYVDWNYIYSLKEPFNPQGIGPKESKAIKELEDYRPSLSEKIIKSKAEKRKSELKEKVELAREEDKRDYEEWKRLHELSGRILKGDVDAYLQVIEEMNPLDDLLDFGSDFEFGIDNPSAMEVEFTVKSSTVVPTYSLSLTKTGKLSRKELTKTAYYDLVQDYVCSCSIRIARDIFALLPLDTVVVHAVDNVVNTQTGHEEEITILSVVFKRDVLEGLNFELIDPSDALSNFRYNMRFLKTGGFKPVERITDY